MIEDKKYGEMLLYMIKEVDMHPKPRWQFLLKDYVLWFVGLLSLLFGALSISLIVYMFDLDEFGAFDKAGAQFWEKLVMIVPIFWLLSLSIFVFIFYYQLRHTKNGYRFSTVMVVAIIFGSSMILGGTFHYLGAAQNVDDYLGQVAPLYDQVINPRIEFWSHPESGRLSGQIIAQPAQMEYRLLDRNKNEWRVIIASTSQALNPKLQIGRVTRFMGKVRADHEFVIMEHVPVKIKTGQKFFERKK